MYPSLLQIGSFTLSTYTLLMSVGLAFALWTLYRRAPAEKHTLWLDTGLAAAVGAVMGARLFYAAANSGYYLAHPIEIMQVWQGGLAWPGAVVGGWLGASFYCSRKREPIAPLLDALALPIAALSLLSWGGCLAAGCAYGVEVLPSQFPTALMWNAPDLYGLIVPRWPTQLAGLAWSLLSLGAVWYAARFKWGVGAQGAFALALVALGAFILSFTRGDPSPLLNQYRLDTVASGALLILTAGMWATRLTPSPTHPITQ